MKIKNQIQYGYLKNHTHRGAGAILGVLPINQKPASGYCPQPMLTSKGPNMTRFFRHNGKALNNSGSMYPMANMRFTCIGPNWNRMMKKKHWHITSARKSSGTIQLRACLT